MIRKFLRSVFVRPFKNYNVEARAEKAMRPENFKSAPKHPTTLNSMKEFEREFEDEKEQMKQKNEKLVKMMQGMVVNPDKLHEPRVKKLPQSKTPAQDPFFEYKLQNISEGKTTLKDVIIFLSEYQQNPEKNNATSIVKKYKLSESDVRNVLKYFAVYAIRRQEQPKTDTVGVIESKRQQQIESGSDSVPMDNRKRSDRIRNWFKGNNVDCSIPSDGAKEQPHNVGKIVEQSGNPGRTIDTSSYASRKIEDTDR